MTSKPKYPLAILFLAALGGCETEESLGPPMDEKPVESEYQYEAQINAGRVYTPPSWGIGKECVRAPELAEFLGGYDWDELDMTNRNKLESLVYWSKHWSEAGRDDLHPWVCIVGEDYQPTPLAPERPPPSRIR